MENKEVYPPEFSKVYDKYWFGFATNLAPQIYDMYSKEAIFTKEKTLIDICCGPGHLASYFLEKGFSIVGIDLSEKMLEIAQNKAKKYNKNAEWIKADAAKFALNKKFGLAVSTFDSLNLLEDLDALNRCFQCVSNHLVDSGVFIFDINTRAGIATNNNVYITENDNFTVIVKGYFDGQADKGYLKFSGFSQVENGLFEKFEHYASNTVFTIDDIYNLLIKANFKDVRYYKLAGTQMEAIDDPESSLKVAIYAQK